MGWQPRITALFKLSGLKDSMLNGEPALKEENNTLICAIILSKLSTNTQKNVVNSENEDNSQLLWKSIIKCFISLEPSSFEVSNIEKFITEVRSILVKMEDVVEPGQITPPWNSQITRNNTNSQA
ncbi:hypothetical protein VP01_4690g1 [Puccinia sorghi]|uniref:Uncharacterized protein n=1 Tax=Puccinia sorghi TaxID=27349 RepID=A0A0L6UN40_9BASI|nr:hypothetical protein VP01_4690g1 [Puccinia sorghi]